ncbi:MAG: sugar phosphotransferase [Acidobacteria bacterium]|nr:MAG: sugar phosphotransferase [Acidobacteriota bacterium]
MRIASALRSSLVRSSARAYLARRLTVEQKLWIRRLRWREHPWQHRQRRLRRELAARRGGDPVLVSGRPAKILTGPFDARAELFTSLRVVRETLSQAHVEFVELPRLEDWAPTLCIRAGDLGRTVDALRELPTTEGWCLEYTDLQGRKIAAPAVEQRLPKIAGVRAYRRLLGPNGRQLSTRSEHVCVEPWDVLGPGVDRVDGSVHVEGTVHRRIQRRGELVEYFTPQAWRETVEDHGSTAHLPAPHLLRLTEPVDIVYTWVDGRDPAWQQRKRAAQGELAPEEIHATAANHSRYASRDELRYSLRSVEYYASWVNHIYLVTDRQIPEWLDTSHPKITVVDHREIFADPSVLPVFNSHAIESQLHHIEGLSEHYIYCNDDFMFLRPTCPEMFFTSNGLSKFFPSTAPLDPAPPSVRDVPVLAAAKRNRQFMVDEHRRAVTNKFKHTPHPQLRSVMSEFEASHQEMFDAVAASRFRHPMDYSIAAALYHFHAHALGRAIVGSIAYTYVDIGRQDAALLLERLKQRHDLDVVTLNDTHVDETEEDTVAARLAHFLDDRFPCPSSFEMDGPASPSSHLS